MSRAVLLHEFLVQRREQILARCKTKVGASSAEAGRCESELTEGLSRYIDEIIEALRLAAGPPHAARPADASAIAAGHGGQRFRLGFKITDVVYDYGCICDAITEEALEHQQPISVAEFRVLNQSLDAGIAEGISEYARRRESLLDSEHVSSLGFIAHELRNALSGAVLSFQMLKSGGRPVVGPTADILERSQERLRWLIDRMLTDVRLQSATFHFDPVGLPSLLEEVEASYALAASAHHVALTLQVGSEIVLQADRQLLLSAVGNLVQNAIKYTRPAGHVVLRGIALGADRVSIEVEDECGGLLGDDPEGLFRLFEQRHQDRSGLGLGLAITRRAIEAHAGNIHGHNLANRGCIFVIELPRSHPA